MSFATNEDLVDYYTTAMDHGVADWSAELAQAQGDIETLIKSRWFNKEFNTGQRYKISSPQNFQTFDANKLTESQWTRACCYRALACYILPKLSTFRPEGDSFREQLNFYQNRFEEEFNLQLGAGVEYDTDGDGTVEAGEKYEVASDRMYR